MRYKMLMMLWWLFAPKRCRYFIRYRQILGGNEAFTAGLVGGSRLQREIFKQLAWHKQFYRDFGRE